MALDATVGGEDSNSYVTVSEADTYFENRTHASAWEQLENKESYLITASKQLDWYISWKGTKQYDEQAMDWPRSDALSSSGVEYPEDEIPNCVKEATFEMALSSLDIDRTADQDLDGLAEVRAASLMIKTDSSLRSKKFETIPDKIRRILADVTANSGIRVVRLLRA